jgi:uroporphyrinogen-III decarboxylase
VDREFYLALARSGLRMPVGTDLVLHEKPDPERILQDGQALGRVVEETARRFRTPLAFGHMDLTLEKAVLLEMLDIPADQIPLYHFSGCPTEAMREKLQRRIEGPLNPRLRAHIESIDFIARHTDLIPVGMGIGPFSLMTKLFADPITPIYLAGSGVTADDDPDVKAIETGLELALSVVLRSFSAQIAAGAKAVFVAEPAANVVYISPRQMESESTIFDRYVGHFNRRLKQLFDRNGVDLIFHCCGELIDSMVQQFAALDPVILSLGSSRKLWEDARIVPEQIVLYGNLPSKHFYSDELISLQEVERRACELIRRMREAGHPFILGSECDILNMPGYEATIRQKVEAFLRCPCD